MFWRCSNIIQPISYYPPKLQFFQKEHIEKFRDLDKVGEFSVEFLLVVTELLAIQEKTNYPSGSLTESLYKDFSEKDRFSVIQKAVLKKVKIRNKFFALKRIFN
jgi:hypothetical protein